MEPLLIEPLNNGNFYNNSEGILYSRLTNSTFDKLIILLGNFHLELAFFGAVGTFLADSGIEYLITEANVLAEGSLAGFMKGNSITDVPKSIKFLLLLWKESFSLSISN